jgi:hypothetical protein
MNEQRRNRLINEQENDRMIQSVITNASNEQQETRYCVMKSKGKESKVKERKGCQCGVG